MTAFQTKFQEAADGRNTISLTFERESPDSDVPYIETIYQFESVTHKAFKPPALVLLLLSATRTDTRETIELTEEEHRAVTLFAAEKVATALED
jgi:hypothetical protein